MDAKSNAGVVAPKEDSVQARNSATVETNAGAITRGPGGSQPELQSSSQLDASANAGESNKSNFPGTISVRVGDGKNLGFPVQLITLPETDALHAEARPYLVIEMDKNEAIANARTWSLRKKQATFSHRAGFDVSRPADITVSVFVRMPSINGKSGNDCLVGSCKLTPSLIDGREQGVNLVLNSCDGIECGELEVQCCYKQGPKNKALAIEAFELLKVIGKGSFGKVMQVRKRDTNRIYAMKILKKAHIVERSEVSHTLAERAVLAQLQHPFIVPLKFSFQSPDKLYLVLAFVNGGELFHHLQREQRFSEERAKFYAAELLCALDCLHSYGIIYRDLKPENILLDYSGHIALCDFGLCKLNLKEKEKTNTFCGTPEYLAPELLLGQGYTKVVDWWTLGILLYEMVSGLPPFYDENTNEMYKKILSDELKLKDYMSPNVRDILKRLLDRDPNKRLGFNGAQEIKTHPFFADINWQRLLAKKYTPPFKPNVASAIDTSNFDEEFTSEAPVDSFVENSALSESVQQQFAGFTYQGPNHIGSVAVGGSFINNGAAAVRRP